jgi:hypothetical protein
MKFASDLRGNVGQRKDNDLVAKNKSDNPTWSDVKPAVVDLNQKQLLKLVADLYRFSKDNRDFFHARFRIGDDPLAPYRKTIDECMYPDVYTNKPIQISKAKKAISSYSKAISDPLGEIELMVFFVECGNNFTVDFGDIDADFYDALNLMYQRAIQEVLSLPEEQRRDFKERLEKIMTSASGIGWGYYDMLCDDYYSAFPDDS